MPSPAIDNQVAVLPHEVDSDYGSDFSPEEEQIVSQLLSAQPIDVEDNPIVTALEQNDAQQTLRVPLVFGREQRSPLFQAARAAEGIAEHIAKSVNNKDYSPDGMSPPATCQFI